MKKKEPNPTSRHGKWGENESERVVMWTFWNQGHAPSVPTTQRPLAEEGFPSRGQFRVIGFLLPHVSTRD